MKLEKGEAAIVAVQFVALIAVVLLISQFSPGQSVESAPMVNSVYWGSSDGGVALHVDQLTKVSQNASVVTAYFTLAYSTSISSVSGSRLCTTSTSSGVATTYTTIPFTFVASKGTGTVPLSPAGQSVGWVCTYTIKVTDSLSQTVTWVGSVELT